MHLLAVTRGAEGVQRQRRVTDPQVAVVVVSIAAESLGSDVVAAAATAPVSAWINSFSASRLRVTASRHGPR